ncbi:MAG: phosphate acyltransferase PlsX [Candidatus Omnitrophica bacterium]|nr:phosphate acyltransferase PlsX [Candidatus Omnitrophota bacterium]
MKIAIDAMGGDFAPQSTVEGAIQAAKEYGYEIILVGEEFFLKKELSRHKTVPDKISIKHASEIIGMDEAPAVTIRKKKDSSINVAVNLVRDKLADAMVTAGNTGAVVCSAALKLKTLEAIDRPGISVVLPTLLGQTLLIDVGANIDCKPEHLLQYAIMGSVYCRYVLSKKEVKVGLLSIGEEKSKGTELTKIAHSLIDKSSLNFIGNVEGKDIFSGKADVIVCDGFTGNIILKVLESVAETVAGLFKQQLSSNLFTMLGGLLSMPAFRNLKRKVDYAEQGGAPLLGIGGICIVGHGRSSAKAIKNAIRVAAEAALHNVNQHIIDAVKNG